MNRRLTLSLFLPALLIYLSFGMKPGLAWDYPRSVFEFGFWGILNLAGVAVFFGSLFYWILRLGVFLIRDHSGNMEDTQEESNGWDSFMDW